MLKKEIEKDIHLKNPIATYSTLRVSFMYDKGNDYNRARGYYVNLMPCNLTNRGSISMITTEPMLNKLACVAHTQRFSVKEFKSLLPKAVALAKLMAAVKLNLDLHDFNFEGVSI